MKRIKPKTNLEQLLQTVSESTEETLCGGGSPGGGGVGGDIIVFDIVDSVAESGGSGTLIPIKIKHNA